MSLPIETGPLAIGIPMTLVSFDGTETQTRGTIARLPQSADQLMGAFSRSGWNAWVPALPPDAAAQTAILRYVAKGATVQHRILDRENSGAALNGTVTRLQLVDPH